MKFAVFAVLSLCVVSTLGTKYCSYEDAEDVLTNWNTMMDGGNTAPYMLAIFKEVFKKIFVNNPESKDLFTGVNVANLNSPQYEAHVLRVANAFDDVLNKLHSHQVMDQMLNHLSNAHAIRSGITKQHFQLLAKEMESVLQVVLDKYNPDAWTNCISGMLASISSELP